MKHSNIALYAIIFLIFISKSMTSQIFAEQANFKKYLSDAKTYSFDYEISPLPQYIEVKEEYLPYAQGYQINFSLDKNAVAQSYTKVSNLNTLRKEKKDFFEGEMQKLIAKYIPPISDAYTEELLSFVSTNDNQAINISCDKKVFINLTFVYSLTGFHKINSNIASCSTSADSKKLWKLLLADIKKEVQQTNNSLSYGSKVTLQISGNTYKLSTTISAPDQESADKMRKIIAENNALIAAIEKEYDLKTNNIQRDFKKISSEQKVLYNKYKSKLNEAIDTIHTDFLALQTQIFKEGYFLVRDINNRSTISLDYKRIAEDSKTEMQEVALALQDKELSQRAQIFKIMNFLQSIPYNTLQGREQEGYKGFLPPSALLDINKGDCDTKSVALMSILKVLYPDLPVVMVLIPNHAFVGIGIAPTQNDTAIDFEGTRYVVVEPVGPAITIVGEASPISLRYIKRNKFDEIIPVN